MGRKFGEETVQWGAPWEGASEGPGGQVWGSHVDMVSEVPSAGTQLLSWDPSPQARMVQPLPSPAPAALVSCSQLRSSSFE